MVDDRVLEGFIHNMGNREIPKICGNLQAAGFLYASSMSEGYKLDLQLINTLVERWRSETHTFHLPCGECTIVLEYIALQLSLQVDGPVATGFVIVLDKVTLFQSLLDKVPDKFESGRISTNWLKDNFHELVEDPEDRMEEVIQQYAQAHIMTLIEGILMAEKSQNSMHVRWLLHLVDFNDCMKLS
ncbi:hypothetical protein J1N35_019313 [Gossypium stocksii]|uniref:Aminotransferase-like plant mobile domain-containing protein n=1 Tax=Gossypium stocksii TaxID=47602 RepID=A0A9D3VQN3_9ROSI|nr:hypothetical protein J1N35_019313 [Gossypium stocksii]